MEHEDENEGIDDFWAFWLSEVMILSLTDNGNEGGEIWKGKICLLENTKFDFEISLEHTRRDFQKTVWGVMIDHRINIFAEVHARDPSMFLYLECV